MARRTAIRPLQQINEVNMTPLIDLTFLLLITFIITFPLIEQGIPVNLPRGKAQNLEDERSRTISLDAHGVVYLDDVRISKEELAVEMQAAGAADSEITIMVRADEAIAYGRLVDILRILHDAKIARMALVTLAEEKPGR
jgi:biopolymer transport protein TolR